MIKRFGIILMSVFLLVSCGQSPSDGKLKKVGLLVPETINDQVWGTKGYKGVLNIQSRFNIEVYYKEGMNSEPAVERAVREFDQKGVNLIFGHGSEYADFFNHLAQKYPHIHFVSFNGNAKEPNTTTLNFEGYAMGFFGGMVAGHMTKSNHIGMIAAYDWQPEVRGFLKGVAYQNKKAQIDISYVGQWDDNEKALGILNKMIKNKVDVVYPAGDGFNVALIEKLKEEGLYAIGYVSDQSDLGKTTVLTSTVQHVDALYELVAEKYNNDELKSGNLSFDFKDNVISLGKFSPVVDKKFINTLNAEIEKYKNTGKLPDEK